MRRLAVAVAIAAVALPAAPGQAVNKKPQIIDAATDSRGGQAGLEVVNVLWTTTGETVKTKVRGKTVTQYTPKKLVVTMNLAGAPLKQAPFYYEASADFAGCGQVRFTYSPGTAYSLVVSDQMMWYDCGPEGLTLVVDVKTTVGAKSITWEYPIKALGKAVKIGGVVSTFHASADVVDPVLGLYGPKDLGQPIDEGVGDVTWKLGS